MAYFEFDAPLSRLTVARAEAVNALFQQISDAFDKLPSQAQFIESRVSWATASGSNNVIATLPLQPEGLSAGLFVRFIQDETNTGPMTLNVNDTGVRDLVRPNGAAVEANDFVSGQVVQVSFDGEKYRALGFLGSDLKAAADSAASAKVSEDFIAENLNAINAISNNLAEILTVEGSITSVVDVANAISDIEMAVLLMDQILRVSAVTGEAIANLQLNQLKQAEDIRNLKL